MAVTVKIDGEKRLRRKLNKMPKAARKAINKALNAEGANMSKEAKASIRRSGGKYIQYGNHWSSLPGNPPNEISGDLRRSIRLKRITLTNKEMKIISELDYAFWLEFGTRYMEARPFLRPAFRKFSPIATKAMRIAFKEAMREVSRQK